MARKKSPTLTDSELRIMEVLWERGSASVRQVTEDLSRVRPTAYNTVLTMLRILKNKGYVDYLKQGRAFIYHSLMGREEARTNVVRYLLDRFFNNSPDLLVQNLLDDEKLAPAELERLKKRLSQGRGEVE